jgi:alkylation response protein AidB-like acyl-CoA dehydrogenase
MTTAAAEPAALEVLRADVREFLRECRPSSRCDAWMRDFDPAFSRTLGRRGWIGMTMPREYGGHGRSYLERYVVTEELLRAGAPVAAHWFADRQIGPMLLASGNTRLTEELLPGICRGEIYFSIGMSEPGAGSDLAAIATRARRVEDGWVVNGQKVWTTGALSAHFVYLIARTGGKPDDPHTGLSEFIVPMDAPGLTVRPIRDLSDETHFAELFFDDVRLESWRLLGEPGDAFARVIAQLDYERSGPERFLSTYPLFAALLADPRAEGEWRATIGALAARYATLQAMSMAIARTIDEGAPPSAYSALVKDLGATLEQDVIRAAEELTAGTRITAECAERLREATISAPAYTIRGGTAEILREIVARRMLKLGR